MTPGSAAARSKRRASDTRRAPPDGAEPPERLDLITDEDLFAAVQTGSEPHFNALYERYFHRIYAFVVQRVRNHADAEELTQETFTAVFHSAAAWSGRASPLAWIYGIAKNTVSNHLRRSRTYGQRLEQAGPFPLVTTSPTWSFTPEEQLSLDRTARAMDETLGKMGDWQVEAFRLRHVENLSIGEISVRVDRSGDAVRSGLYRVKRLLVEAGSAETSGHRL